MYDIHLGMRTGALVKPWRDLCTIRASSSPSRVLLYPVFGFCCVLFPFWLRFGASLTGEAAPDSSVAWAQVRLLLLTTAGVLTAMVVGQEKKPEGVEI